MRTIQGGGVADKQATTKQQVCPSGTVHQKTGAHPRLGRADGDRDAGLNEKAEAEGEV